jgi:hypothetical protein
MHETFRGCLAGVEKTVPLYQLHKTRSQTRLAPSASNVEKKVELRVRSTFLVEYLKRCSKTLLSNILMELVGDSHKGPLNNWGKPA